MVAVQGGMPGGLPRSSWLGYNGTIEKRAGYLGSVAWPAVIACTGLATARLAVVPVDKKHMAKEAHTSPRFHYVRTDGGVGALTRLERVVGMSRRDLPELDGAVEGRFALCQVHHANPTSVMPIALGHALRYKGTGHAQVLLVRSRSQ